MSLGKTLKRIGKAFSKPQNILFPVLGMNEAIGNTLNVDMTQMALYAAGGALIATGFGAPVGGAMMATAAGLGAGLSAAQQGTFGKGVQDVATMGASAQVRYNQKMAEAYNQAQKEQARIAEENNRQNLLQQIRAARIARAMNLTDYAGETGVTSSGALGNLGSIGSQYLSNLGYSVRTGQAANAYQTYMNQYNQYQTQARNSAIKWQNRANTINTALSIYGMGQGLQTQQLQNYYAGLKLNDAWTDAYTAQSKASAVPTTWAGRNFSYGV